MHPCKKSSGRLIVTGKGQPPSAVWIQMSQGTGALRFGYGSALAAAIQLPMAQRWDSLSSTLAADWKPELCQGFSTGMSPSYTGLRAFRVCFASTDRNRTFLEQTNTPRSCLFRAPGSTRKIKPRPSPWFTSPWRTGSGQSC